VSSATEVAPERVEPAIPVRRRLVAFSVTWVAYFTYYIGRKGLSAAKTTMVKELGASSIVGVETGLLTAYAIGQYASGFIGDRVGARRLVTIGLLVSAAACLVFGLSSLGGMFVLAYVVNGFAQSTGWPGTTKAMAEWTTRTDRGKVMGLWGTCYQVGGAVATIICAALIGRYGWRAAFIGPSVILVAVALIVHLFLERGPNAAAGGSRGPLARPEPDAEAQAIRKREQRRVLASPIIYSYGTAYFCIKLVRYSLLFWLPWYLTEQLGYATAKANYVSTAFEFGGFFGTVTLGWLSDRSLRSASAGRAGRPRAVFAGASLVLLAGALALFNQVAGTSTIVCVATLALVGFFLFGPDALISGAAAQDVGGKYAAGFAAGVVNGIGSMGAILQELVTKGVSAAYGWNALFLLFVVLALLSALCLVPSVMVQRKAAFAGAIP
jgi:sugar phosphate permease